MSLFSTKSNFAEKIIDPKKVNIEGEIAGNFFAGRIEMIFLNDYCSLDDFTILIGKNTNSRICLHDFQVKVDENPFLLQIIEIKEAQKNFREKIKEGEKAVFGIGDDSYATIAIPNILRNQMVTISVNFELPVTFISHDTIGIFFPLTLPGLNNDKLLKCSDFYFSLNFSYYHLPGTFITSNPDGNIDFLTRTYTIDHLDPTLTNLSISFNTQNATFSKQLQNSIVTGVAMCCENYGSFTFIPTKEVQNYDHSGEEFIFIVDCSDSMSGGEIKLARQCLTFFIKSLPENSYFNVIRFGTSFIPLFQSPLPYNDSNSNKALNLANTLKADLGGTVLSNPLSYVFKAPLSQKDKLRRVFVLTDGCVYDRKEVLNLVRSNSITTMCSSIGIGYGVDQKLVKGISRYGNGFVDFVLSGDDMRSKVINQLAQSLNGLCKIDISIENNESVEILPPLSNCQLSPGIPATFYFKAPNEFDENLNVCIEIEGNSESTVLELKKLPESSNVKRSLEYLFNNENIRILRELEPTDEIVSKIIQLSITYGILTPYTGLFGVQEKVCHKEKEKTKLLRDDPHIKNKLDQITVYVKTLTGKHFDLRISSSSNIYELKHLIQESHGYPIDQQRLIFAGRQLEDRMTLFEYYISDSSTIHLVLRLRGGGRNFSSYAKRTFLPSKAKDLISIVSEQEINGCWKNVPNFLINEKLNEFIQKVKELCVNTKISDNFQSIVGTVSSLAYMAKYKKECFKMWSLIFEKGIKWLHSIDSKIDWNGLIQNLMTEKIKITETQTEKDADEEEEEKSEEEEEEEETEQNQSKIIINVEDDDDDDVVVTELVRAKKNNVIFLLDNDDKTACVIGNDSAKGDVFIPRSIEHDKKEFIIKNFFKDSFKNSTKIKSIRFSPDSSIQSIEKDAFANSSIVRIELPSSLCDLKEGWCRKTPNLRSVTVMPKSNHFMYIDNKMLVGKSDQKSDEYDCLLFVRRDIENISIPSFIKRICAYSFSQTLIKSITIPSGVEHVCRSAFSWCKKLKSVEIPEDSHIKTIDEDAFKGCKIENMAIPKKFKSMLNDL